jgi:hypothetical protein
MKKMKMRLLAGLAAAVASAQALAVDPTTASEGFTQAQTSALGFGPGMWGLAAGSVAILIGVKWIKRARGAA